MPFEPTPSSVPPPNVCHRMRLPPGLPVNITPLNPIQFLLRAALIQPNKVAIRHPDIERPVEYSYAVWCVLVSLLQRNDWYLGIYRAQRIQNFAHGLLARGIQPGDRVAVVAPNWSVSSLTGSGQVELNRYPQSTHCWYQLRPLQLRTRLTFKLEAHHAVIAARAVVLCIKYLSPHV
jgi:acyl-CoA synthetase (AMP-forming)/AMP-acid ligase II